MKKEDTKIIKWILIIAIAIVAAFWLKISSPSFKASEVTSLSSVEPSGAIYDVNIGLYVDSNEFSLVFLQSEKIDFILDINSSIEFLGEFVSCYLHNNSFSDKLIFSIQKDSELGIALQVIWDKYNSPTYEKMLDAIEQQESGGDPNAVCDDGCCVGAFQLTKIYVDDVNRIMKWQMKNWRKIVEDADSVGSFIPAKYNDEKIYAFDYADRWNKYKSELIVRIYLNHYATEKRLSRIPTYEDMARIHNGGPDGWKKKSTEAYWELIKARLVK